MKKNISHIVKTRILVHSNYHPDNFGGIERVVSSIIKAISSDDIEIGCIYFGNTNKKSSTWEKVKFYPVNILFKVFGAPIGLFGNIKLILIGRRFELIVFQEPMPTLWPAIFILRKIFKRQIIVSVHAIPDLETSFVRTYNKLRNFIFSGSQWVATSPQLLDQLQLSKEEKTEVIPLSCSDKVSVPETLNLPNNFALYFGRLANYKGISILLEAAKLIPKITIVIAGDGPMKDHISDFKKSHDLENLIFMNRHFSESEKIELIRKSKFLLFPSTNKNEAFGIIQLEAMREAKPVINTKLDNGVNFVAPDGICAVTVKPKDANELALAIHKLWSDQEKVIQLGNSGRQRYEQLFSEEQFSKSWKNLLNRYITSS